VRPDAMMTAVLIPILATDDAAGVRPVGVVGDA
jgi:hypothetical protein